MWRKQNRNTGTEDESMDELNRALKVLEKSLNDTVRHKINYDEDFEKISKKNISDRDDAYTELLNHYVEITKRRNNVKETHKWIYFWIIMLLMVMFGIVVFRIMNKIDLTGDQWGAGITVVISCLVSFASVIISIPLIITKYLFSTKEDNNIAKIILHTQKHDLSGKRIIETKKENEHIKEDSSIIKMINDEVKKQALKS